MKELIIHKSQCVTKMETEKRAFGDVEISVLLELKKYSIKCYNG